MIHDEYLRHHGIPNQKWGQRNGPPYPLSGKIRKKIAEKSKKKSEKVLRSGDSKGPINAIKKAKKIRKQRKANEERIARLEASRKERETEANKAKERERVLREGRASEILQNKSHYTTQQLQDAANRIKWENTLADYAAKEKSPNFKKIEKYMKTAKTVNDWVSTGVDSKKNIDALIKIFGEASKKAEQEQKKKKKKDKHGINEGDSLD